MSLGKTVTFPRKVKSETTFHGLNEEGDAVVDIHMQVFPECLIPHNVQQNPGNQTVVVVPEGNVAVTHFLNLNEDNGISFSLQLLLRFSKTENSHCNANDSACDVTVRVPPSLNECTEDNESLQEKLSTDISNTAVCDDDDILEIKEEVIEEDIEEIKIEPSVSMDEFDSYMNDNSYRLDHKEFNRDFGTDMTPINSYPIDSFGNSMLLEGHFIDNCDARNDANETPQHPQIQAKNKKTKVEETRCLFCRATVKLFEVHLRRMHMHVPRVKRLFEECSRKERKILVEDLRKQGCEVPKKKNGKPGRLFRCMFCRKRVPQLPEHFKKKHMCEPEVRNIFDVRDLEERATLLGALIAKGKSTKFYTARKLDPTSKIQRQKLFLCIFCQQVVSGFSQHIKKYHSTESRVKERYAKGNARARATLLIELCKEGNLQASPCQYCQCFCSPVTLKKHVLVCALNPARKVSTDDLVPLDTFPVAYDSATEILKTQVFPRMGVDDETLIAKKDEVICAFAVEFMRCERRYESKVNACIQSMRRLSQLLVLVHEALSIDKWLDALKPEYFNKIVDIVKKKWSFNAFTGLFGYRASPAMVGAHLKDCCDLAYKLGKEKKMNKKLLSGFADFKELIETQWPGGLWMAEKANMK